ncbi:MAG TPA: hypothetical protein VIN08_15055 [Ohtaekwangia sp.]
MNVSFFVTRKVTDLVSFKIFQVPSNPTHGSYIEKSGNHIIFVFASGIVNMKEFPFLELIGHICKKPAMYTGGSVKETLAFIDGYRFGNNVPISVDIFDRFVCARNSFPGNYTWGSVIISCAKDDNDAFRLIEENISEFIRLREEISDDDELIQYVVGQLAEEGEAEKIFRQFDKALLSGDELLLRSLIEEHHDAHLLWQAAYPEGIAVQLQEISDVQPIRSIPVSEDGKKVKIIAPGWPFPIEMNFKNGKWKVDANPIIQFRKRSNI